MLTVRNSLKGETIFGQVQEGEHKIEYKSNTRDNNAWNLFADKCLYIDLKEKPEEFESDTLDDEELSKTESESTDDLNLKRKRKRKIEKNSKTGKRRKLQKKL